MLEQIAKFLASGVAATLLHWGVMAGLIQSGTRAITATAIGALAGMGLNYITHHRLTFRSNRRHREALPRYCITAIGLWLINLIVFSSAHAGGIGMTSSQVLATAMITATHFLTARRFVFNDRKSPSAHTAPDHHHPHS